MHRLKNPGLPEVIILCAPRWGDTKLWIWGLMRKPPERLERMQKSPHARSSYHHTVPNPGPVAEGPGCGAGRLYSSLIAR